MNTFPVFTIQGYIHPCYPASERFKKCANASQIPRTECYDVKEDYLNCIRKGTMFENTRKREINKNKILSIPTYDLETDQFKDLKGNVVEPPK